MFKLVMLKRAVALSALIFMGGCSQDSGSAPSPTADADMATDQWIGRWTGVEGLYLDISQDDAAGPGHYLLEMQYGLDSDQSGTFEGQATNEGISFTRHDGSHLLRAGDGEATGMKWLLDKEECLVVQPGEGYCRD